MSFRTHFLFLFPTQLLSRRMISRANVAAGVVALFFSLTSAAQSPAAPATGSASKGTVIAMLSLIGDSLSVVVNQYKTGTNLDPNRRQIIALQSDEFDQLAIRSLAKAMMKEQPGIELAALNARSPVLFERQKTLFAESGGRLSMPGAIVDAAKAQGATQLVVILKRRDAATFPFINGYFADGAALEGIGFFVDGTVTVNTRSDSGDRITAGQGFIAPFVFAELIHVNLADSRVINRYVMTDSFMVGAGKSAEGSDAWNAMDGTKKAQAIREIITQAMTNAAPLFLKSNAANKASK
jgi:hypothetical protein